jgi:superfamily I DNA/RNA helicase
VLARLRRAGLEVSDLGHDETPGRLALVPASRVKGLEFDHVVVVEPAAIAAAEPRADLGLRRLYVVLTRAVSTLTVVHALPLPDAFQ